jgi:hypothetical protein
MSDIVQHLDKAYRDLSRWMVKHPKEVIRQRQEFSAQLIKKRCVYGEATMKTTLMPLFLKPKSLELISKVAMELDRVIDKVIGLYFEDPSIRDYFPYHDVPKEWIEHDPGYKKPTVINRLDALFDGKTLKFIEFNADNPGGRGWTDMYEDVYRQHPLYKDLIGSFGTRADRPIAQGVFNSMSRCLAEYQGRDPAEPPPKGTRMAIATFSGSGAHGDEEIVRDFFIERGVETNLIDPRDMELKKGKLYSNGVKFDLILRSMKAQYYLRYPREVRDFIQGVTSGAACLVNSFRALLGSEKAILSFLTNPLTQDRLTESERKLIQKHVPWTRKLDETITLSKEGDEVDLREYVVTHKDELVLKPSWGAGGYGVLVGKSAKREDWEACVAENMGAPWWTVQEYVEIPQLTLPVIKQGKVVLEKKYLNLSPFVFGGQYVGLLGRVSDKDVINVSAGGGLIPVFPMKAGASVPDAIPAAPAAAAEAPEPEPADTASARPGRKRRRA